MTKKKAKQTLKVLIIAWFGNRQRSVNGLFQNLFDCLLYCGVCMHSHFINLLLSPAMICIPILHRQIKSVHQPRFFDIFREYKHILAINLFTRFRVMSLTITVTVTSRSGHSVPSTTQQHGVTVVFL